MNANYLQRKIFTEKTLYRLMLLTVASIPLFGIKIQLGATFRLEDIFTLIASFILFADFLWIGTRKDIPKSFYFVRIILLVFFYLHF